MGRAKRLRKEKMKRDQAKRARRVFAAWFEQNKGAQLRLEAECIRTGHEPRQVPGLGRVCVRCGRDMPEAAGSLPPGLRLKDFRFSDESVEQLHRTIEALGRSMKLFSEALKEALEDEHAGRNTGFRSVVERLNGLVLVERGVIRPDSRLR